LPGGAVTAGLYSLRCSERVPVHLVHRQLAPQRHQLRHSPASRLVTRKLAVGLAAVDIDEALAMVDEDDLAQGRDLLVVLIRSSVTYSRRVKRTGWTAATMRRV
jgi:hypothetical protein